MTTTLAPTRADILDAFRRFVTQRPRMEPGNYGDVRSYRRELAEVGRDMADALALLAAVERSYITAEAMLEELRSARRLSWDAERQELDYCTGQYFATEYRPAAARALSSMLWAYYRDECHADTADKIRAAARRGVPFASFVPSPLPQHRTLKCTSQRTTVTTRRTEART
jgi:hypothetical protein